MEREPQPERDVEEMEERADALEKEIDEAHETVEQTDGTGVEAEEE